MIFPICFHRFLNLSCEFILTPCSDESAQVQDTIAICPAVASQKVAMAALESGRQWVWGNSAGVGKSQAADGNVVPFFGGWNFETSP